MYGVRGARRARIGFGIPSAHSPTMDPLNADEVLALYLAGIDEPAAERFLHTLIADVAAPYVRVVVGSTLRGAHQAEADDATQEVLLDLTSRLRRLRERQLTPGHTEEPPIHNFRAYIGAAARRAAGFVLRRSNPERHRLRNRIRHSLKTSSSFTLTEDEMGRWLAGLRQWSGPSVSDAPAAAIEKLREIPVPQGAAGMSLPRLMELILIGLSQPVFLNDLADYIGAALGGVGRLEDPGEADARPSSGPSAAPSSGIVNQLEQRDWLSQLWTEIAQLPRNQKAALLLNLRDHNGDSALHLFPSMGIATIRQIAAALEMPAPELAEAWRELPVSDLEIAAKLSLTRQQIVNLRKSARERLIRRTGQGR